MRAALRAGRASPGLVCLGPLCGALAATLALHSAAAPAATGRFVETSWAAFALGLLAWALAETLAPHVLAGRAEGGARVGAGALGAAGLTAGCAAFVSGAPAGALFAADMASGAAAGHVFARLFGCYEGCCGHAPGPGRDGGADGGAAGLPTAYLWAAISAVLAGLEALALVLAPSIVGAVVAYGVALVLSMAVLAGRAVRPAAGGAAPSEPAPATSGGQTSPGIRAPFVRTALPSAPVLYVLLWALTTGTRVNFEGSSIAPFLTLLAAGALALAVIGVAARRQRGVGLAFLLFRVALPAWACLALSLKVIPVSFVSGTLFHWAMEAGFALAAVTAWAFLAYAAANRCEGPETALAGLPVVLAAALLLGTLLTLLPDDLKFALLGVVTSAFLLYEALYLGRSAVAYTSPERAEGEGGADRPARGEGDRRDRAPTVAETCASLADSCGLTRRESEVLLELARGHSSAYVAETLCVAPSTVRSHTKSIYAKLGVESRDGMLELFRGCAG